MTLKKILKKTGLPILAAGLFTSAAIIGLQGDNLKYKKTHEVAPQSRISYITGEIKDTDIEGLSQEQQRQIKDLYGKEIADANIKKVNENFKSLKKD